MRHDRLRDLEAEMMHEVCKDVKIEPRLLPLANNDIVDGNITENARSDVSGVGVWAPMERTFLDIHVFHPNCKTYVGREVAKVYKEKEQGKKRAYNERIIQVEKGTFK